MGFLEFWSPIRSSLSFGCTQGLRFGPAFCLLGALPPSLLFRVIEGPSCTQESREKGEAGVCCHVAKRPNLTFETPVGISSCCSIAIVAAEVSTTAVERRQDPPKQQGERRKRRKRRGWISKPAGEARGIAQGRDILLKTGRGQKLAKFNGYGNHDGDGSSKGRVQGGQRVARRLKDVGRRCKCARA